MWRVWLGPRHAEADLRKLFDHLCCDDLQRGRWAEHHLQLGDQPFVIEREFVDALDVLSVHVSRELEDRDAGGRVLELVHIAEGATDPEHPLGRLQYLQDLVATLIGREDDGAEEDDGLVEQVPGPVDVALLDSGTEAVRASLLAA